MLYDLPEEAVETDTITVQHFKRRLDGYLDGKAEEGYAGKCV